MKPCASVVVATTCFASPMGWAQTTLAPVVVTSSPLGSELFDYAPPAQSIAGPQLRQKSGTTVGDMLVDEVGVTSTYFGPNAGRPVIRGLDGDRVRILQNGIGTIDASAASADHAVSVDPLMLEKAEVIRGPAAILYGGSAVGGVVNLIDGRIAQDRLDGVQGAIDVRYGSAQGERSQSARVDAGNGGLVLHADVFNRATGELRIPDFARSQRKRERDPLPAGEEEARGRLPNSRANAEGGGIGASAVWDKGYAGLAYSQVDSRYGTVAEPNVSIGLQQRRFELAGEVRDIAPLVKALKWKSGHSDYQHIEYDGSSPGTTFLNKGSDSRLELHHVPIAGMNGAVGLQFQEFRFSALGDEAFLPRTRSQSSGLFIYEERAIDSLRLSGGVRVDQADVRSFDDARFGAGTTRTFTPKSASLGAVWSLGRAYAVALNVSATERAPSYQELFANGPHVATGTFERGSTGLGMERSRGLDLSLRKREGALTGSIGVFYNRFSNYIALIDQGATDVDSNLPIFAYQQVRAELQGFEWQGAWRVWERGGERVRLELRGDTTRATNLDTNEPLPRISPLRYGGAMGYELGAFAARVDVLRVTAQRRVASHELPTDAYTMLNATLSYKWRSGRNEIEAWLRGQNLLNSEARVHASFLKDIAPLAGRGVVIGMRWGF